MLLSAASLASRFAATALNPQPLPPRDALGSLASRLDLAALNPQPLPPKAGESPLQRLGFLLDDFCGTVPRRLPGFPPPPPPMW